MCSAKKFCCLSAGGVCGKKKFKWSCSWWATQGHYVPQLAQMILEGNAKPGARQLNLKGFLLGAPATALCDALLNVNVARLFCPCSSYTRSWQVQNPAACIQAVQAGQEAAYR